jgi:hypothetical protein
MQIVVHNERLFGFYLKKSEMKILSLLYILSLLSTATFVYQREIKKMCLRIDTCLSAIDLRKKKKQNSKVFIDKLSLTLQYFTYLV